MLKPTLFEAFNPVLPAYAALFHTPPAFAYQICELARINGNKTYQGELGSFRW